MKTLTTMLVGSALAVATLASAPAQALLATNGREINGMTLNGMTLNGRELNGVTVNGVTVNGTAAQGAAATGQEAAEAGKLSVTRIRLPDGTRLDAKVP